MAEKQKTSDKKNKKAPAKDQKLKEQLAVVEENLAQEKERYLRLFAEFENFKKRNAKERIELFKTANQESIQAMIPILDDFERALSQAAKENAPEVEGFELIAQKFKEILQQQGLKNCSPKAGDVFDAELHEAITQIPAQEPELKGTIVDIVEQGYQLGERIIRYPKVVVAQ
ncbi:MAG: nucleotide exchange factor GrpE [Flavobacteriaceae bacterium]